MSQIPIGTNLYKSEDTSVLRTGSVGPMVSLIKRLHYREREIETAIYRERERCTRLAGEKRCTTCNWIERK